MSTMIMSLIATLVVLIQQNHGSGRHYIAIDELKSWTDAQIFCQANYGLDLATVTDAEDVRALMGARIAAGISEQTTPHGIQLFIGLNDRTTEGQFGFIQSGITCPFTGSNKQGRSTCYPPSYGDCSPGDTYCQSFTTNPSLSSIPRWGGGEPNNAGGVEDCVTLSIPTQCSDTLFSGINDGNCGDTRRFACNYDPDAVCTASFPGLFNWLDTDVLVIGLLLSNILVICLLVCICYRLQTRKVTSYASVKEMSCESEEDDQEKNSIKIKLKYKN
eukprot:394276_1